MFHALKPRARLVRRVIRPARGPFGRHRSAAMMLSLLVATAAALVAPSMSAGAMPAAPTVMTPVNGVYDRLAVAWWQYALAQPTATSPLTDPTGADCAIGQSGPVFFLSGVSGSGSATRDQCTLPGSKALFFPLFNAFDVHVPGDGLDTPDLVYRDFLSFGARAETLRASVDGVAIGDLDPATTPFRACAAPVAGCAPRSFSLTLPADNAFGVAAGKYQPAVQDGFYLLLAPLRPGVHTITFGSTGTFQGAAVEQNITYQLRVAG